MTPLLVPAWPSVMRVGLPCVLQSGERGPFIAWLDHMQSVALVAIQQDEALTEAVVSVRRPKADHLRLDLRDAAVRDAVARAMWAKLRPGEPEPVTAPRWQNNAERRYSLVGRFMRDTSDTTYDVRFRPTPGGRSPECEDIVVPALGDLPRDSFERPQDFADRDLLALAACAAAVLS